MNIFPTNLSPIISAQELDDKRVNRIISETCWLLAGVLTQGNDSQNIITNKNGSFTGTGWNNHPWAKWAGLLGSNFIWIVNYLNSLCNTFELAYGHKHSLEKNVDKLWSFIDSSIYLHNLSYNPPANPTLFPNCSLLKFPVTTNEEVTYLYRLTLNMKWQHDKLKGRNPTWKNRSVPSWARY